MLVSRLSSVDGLDWQCMAEDAKPLVEEEACSFRENSILESGEISVPEDEMTETCPRVPTGVEPEKDLFVPVVYEDGDEARRRLMPRWHAQSLDPDTTHHQVRRFFTLNKRRRKKRTSGMFLHASAILDDLYNGPTMCVLRGVDLWDFNAFLLDNVCGGRPVSMICVFLLHQHGLLSHFSLDPVTVWKCFSLVEDHYHTSNPYHNAVHAADVTQAMHCFLKEDAIKEHLTPLEKFSAIIAAVCHDLDHPGVNQPFLIATDNHLASLYNNASVLENHHWRCAMGCIWESGLLKKWTKQDIDAIQQQIRSLILATDMTRQNEFLNKFSTYLEKDSIDMSNAEHRHFCLQIALKCADISNISRPWETSRQWSHRICDELYRQGDYERQLKLPITSICDRYINSVAKIQLNFIKFMAFPLFDAWNRWLSSSLSCSILETLQQNLNRWDRAAKDDEPVGAYSHLKLEATLKETTVKTASNTLEIPDSKELTSSRRHSMPHTLPSSLPKTIIRRESTSESGEAPLVIETLMMGQSVVDTVMSVKSNVETVPLSMPSVSMAKSSKTKRYGVHSRTQRRQSLPPLWDPLLSPPPRPFFQTPPTPLEEEVPFIPEEVPKKKLPAPIAEESVGSSSNKCPRSSNASQKGTGQFDRRPLVSLMRSTHDTLFEVDKENVFPQGDKFERHGSHVHPKARLKSQNIEEPFELSNRGSKGLLKSIPQNANMGRRGSAPLLRQEDLRSTSKLSERAILGLQKRRGSAPASPFKICLGREGSVPCGEGGLVWLSVNCDSVCSDRLANHLPANKTVALRRVRGTRLAVLTRGNSFSVVETLLKQTVSDPFTVLAKDRMTQQPLKSKENLSQEADRVCGGLLVTLERNGVSNRRSSAPWDGSKGSVDGILHSHSHSAKHYDPEALRKFSEGGVGLAMGTPLYDLRGEFAGGGSLTPHYFDARRGSTGFELMSGLWRLRIEQPGTSLCSEESMAGFSSSGCGTPGTPCVPSGLAPSLFKGAYSTPIPLLRRGSLPTDIFIGGDAPRWNSQPS